MRFIPIARVTRLKTPYGNKVDLAGRAIGLAIFPETTASYGTIHGWGHMEGES